MWIINNTQDLQRDDMFKPLKTGTSLISVMVKSRERIMQNINHIQELQTNDHVLTNEKQIKSRLYTWSNQVSETKLGHDELLQESQGPTKSSINPSTWQISFFFLLPITFWRGCHSGYTVDPRGILQKWLSKEKSTHLSLPFCLISMHQQQKKFSRELFGNYAR